MLLFLVLPVFGLNVAIRLVCSIEKTSHVVCSAYAYLLKGILGCHGNCMTPETILFHFPFHTDELSSTSSGTHGRDALTESRHSIEEESAPAVKRKCTRDEDTTTQG